MLAVTVIGRAIGLRDHRHSTVGAVVDSMELGVGEQLQLRNAELSSYLRPDSPWGHA